MADCFWFSDAQWERIAPLLPAEVRGKARVDDRRMLSTNRACAALKTALD